MHRVTSGGALFPASWNAARAALREILGGAVRSRRVLKAFLLFPGFFSGPHVDGDIKQGHPLTMDESMDELYRLLANTKARRARQALDAILRFYELRQKRILIESTACTNIRRRAILKQLR